MQKTLLWIAACCIVSLTALAQKDKNKKELKGDEAKELAKDILNQIGFDSAYFLKMSALNACHCIDSVDKSGIEKSKKLGEFSACIDKEVNTYQLSVQLFNSMKGSKKSDTLFISEKNSAGYKRDYYQIERWLLDSCASLKKAIASNDEEREKSFSKNEDALKAYNEGVPFLRKENYKEALPYFEKAVTIDPEFAFAWDNLGICYRRTGNYEKAEAAYKASLKVDPVGKTPLQNLPVVYLLQKKNEEAIAAYQDLLKHYPGDPEVYYGMGIVYFQNLKDMEKALDNMCKAYNIYVAQKSPYRSDAEKVINTIYGQLKKDGKEEVFNRILKENNIKPL